MGGRRPAAVGLILIFLMSLGCRPPRPALAPGVRLESVEGYASLALDSERGRGKSKVSFSVQLPDRARVDVFDALGRSLVSLVNRGDESYFVFVPGKAYWRGGREEMFEKFLGFSLSLEEWAGLMAWRWASSEGAEAAGLSGWTLTRDSKNRVAAAERNGVTFEVKEFFPGTLTPHTLAFRSDRSSGRLKIFEVKFNSLRAAEDAPLWFLQDYEAVTWEGMERLLADEARVVR